MYAIRSYYERMRVAREIGQYKKENNITVLQTARYDEILTDRIKHGNALGLGAEFMSKLLKGIHEESVRQQVEIMNK